MKPVGRDKGTLTVACAHFSSVVSLVHRLRKLLKKVQHTEKCHHIKKCSKSSTIYFDASVENDLGKEILNSHLD